MESAKRKGSPAKTVRKAKKPKKPSDGIKKPTSAYIYFVTDYRMLLKKKGKDTSKVQEVAKLCGVAWKSMSNEEKAPYQAKYETDKARYMSERDAHDKKMGKDPNKPKRPQTPYFCFLAEFRKQMAGKTKDGEKIPTLAGEKWRQMSDADKKKYEEIVEKDKQRYEDEMKEYKKNNPDQGKKPTPKKKIEEEEEEESDDEEDDNDDDDSDDSDDSDDE